MKKTKITFLKTLVSLVFAGIALTGCRTDEQIAYDESEQVSTSEYTEMKGFYLLNEGLMGTNKATLDYYDYGTATYHRNIFAINNPNEVKELGDVGNDLTIYRSNLYAIINNSNKIEVMDAKTAKKITSIPLQQGRSLAFHNGKIYATSYIGGSSPDPNHPYGKVVEIDAQTLKITRETSVGYYPEQLEIVNGKIFVANSGGMRFPNYDKTISVVDLATFKEEKKIEVGPNLTGIKKDSEGDLYVISTGNYGDVKPTLYLVDSKTHAVKKDFKIPVAKMTIVKDKLYFYYNDYTTSTKIFGVIDTKTEEIVTTSLIPKTYQDEIQTPYGIAVNPLTGDIYIADAANYSSTGAVYAFDKNGTFKWKTQGGNIPAHFAFVYR